MFMRTSTAFVFLGLSSLVGCIFSSSNDSPKPCADSSACHSREHAAGPVHGLRADKRVDVSPAEAWPAAPPEPGFPTADEVGRGCAAIAACLSPDDLRTAGA